MLSRHVVLAYRMSKDIVEKKFSAKLLKIDTKNKTNRIPCHYKIFLLKKMSSDIL